MYELVEEWQSTGNLAKRLAVNLRTQQQAHEVAVNVFGLEERDLDQPLIWHTPTTIISVRDQGRQELLRTFEQFGTE